MNKRVAEYLVENHVIVRGEIELYEYGFDLVVKKIIHSILILVSGIISGCLLEMVCFLVSYIYLREYAGGYHAKTAKGCYCCTVAVTVSVLAMCYGFRQFNIGLICMLLSGIGIWRQEPQDSPNKRLSEKEKMLYRKKARRSLVCFGILFLISSYCCSKIAVGIVCAWMVQLVMMCIGRCLKYTT